MRKGWIRIAHHYWMSAQGSVIIQRHTIRMTENGWAKTGRGLGPYRVFDLQTGNPPSGGEALFFNTLSAAMDYIERGYALGIWDAGHAP